MSAGAAQRLTPRFLDLGGDLMNEEQENPAAIAVAHRVEVTDLAGKNDFRDSNPTALELQVRRVVGRYTVSLSLALVIAELAFSSGRQA